MLTLQEIDRTGTEAPTPENLNRPTGDIVISYEDIKNANSQLTATDIKGKDYIQVNERIKAFRMLYPEGFILTEIVSNIDGVCVMRAKAGFYKDNSMVILGTGTAYEKETSSYINKTSYIENCETSAVGRALGMLGLGVDTSVASADEVQNAVNNQRQEIKPRTISEKEKADIETLAQKAGVDVTILLQQAQVQDLMELSYTAGTQMAEALKRKIHKAALEAKNGAEGQTA